MPQDEFLFSVTGKQLVELRYIGEKELKDLGNAHLDKSGVINYFLARQSERTNREWKSKPDRSKVFVHEIHGQKHEFHYVTHGTDVKSFPKGSFYAMHSKAERDIIIKYYKKG